MYPMYGGPAYLKNDFGTGFQNIFEMEIGVRMFSYGPQYSWNLAEARYCSSK